MLTDINEWEYFRGEDLKKLEDWLIEVVRDPNLEIYEGIANALLDKIQSLDPKHGEDYPASEWMTIASTCWGLAEQIEDYVIDNEILSDAHEQPDWPSIYDYREDELKLNVL